jgi:DNA-binding transcriptional LysR family regulator
MMLRSGMAEPDLNLLVALDVLLGDGSVAGAARRLGLSASAMSRTLTRLREATGDPLLVRAGRRMVLTPHAEALRQRTQNAVHEARAVLRPSATEADFSTLQRTFTIRANDGFVEAFGASLIAAATATAPLVRLRSVFWAKWDQRSACRHYSAITFLVSSDGAIRSRWSAR